MPDLRSGRAKSRPGQQPLDSARGERGRLLVLVSAERGGPGAAAQGRRLAKLARRFLGTLRLSEVELSLTLVRDAEIKKLNKLWRGKDKATDVLSFPAAQKVGPGLELLGDIVISTATAQRAAKAYGTRYGDELALYLAHGLLHLLGHDHHRPAQARKMARLEEKLLGGAGMLARSGEGPTLRGTPVLRRAPR